MASRQSWTIKKSLSSKTREPVTERLAMTVWVHLPTSLRLLGWFSRFPQIRDTNVRVSKSRKVRKTLLVHSRLELMSTGLESYQDRPLYQLSYPNLVFFKISELCRPWIYHKKYLSLYYFWVLWIHSNNHFTYNVFTLVFPFCCREIFFCNCICYTDSNVM